MKKLPLFFLSFFLLISVTNAQMTLVFQVNETNGMTAYLPLNGTVNVMGRWKQ